MEVDRNTPSLMNLRAARWFGRDGAAIKPLNLTPREQTDLVVFLETLSSFSNPWRPDDNGRCDWAPHG